MNRSPAGPASARGTALNPPNRFAATRLDISAPFRDEFDGEPVLPPDPRTVFLEDHSESFLTFNDSPDIGFSVSGNPYRGCEHGCAYCYARPTHEYLGFSSGMDFETRIMVKLRAAELLRRELAAPRWRPQAIAMSGVTDCYQPAEARFGITRACLEVLAECRNPVGLITKNFLVVRDCDLLAELARYRAVVVHISLTTLDPDLARRLEPRASLPAFRLKAVERLAAAGVPVGVNLAPMIPGLNDTEMPRLLAAAAAAGARYAGYTILRLPHAVKAIFVDWLERHEPCRKDRVLGTLQEMRGGALNDPRFGHRLRGDGELARNLGTMFRVLTQRHGLNREDIGLSTASFRRPAGAQLELPLETGPAAA